MILIAQQLIGFNCLILVRIVHSSQESNWSIFLRIWSHFTEPGNCIIIEFINLRIRFLRFLDIFFEYSHKLSRISANMVKNCRKEIRKFLIKSIFVIIHPGCSNHPFKHLIWLLLFFLSQFIVRQNLVFYRLFLFLNAWFLLLLLLLRLVDLLGCSLLLRLWTGCLL